MPIQDIYTAYPPSDTDRITKRNELFQLAFDEFLARCRELDADTADDVELPLARGSNMHIWDTVKKRLNQFKTATKLTIFDEKLMTVVRADRLKKQKDPDPIPAPLTPAHEPEVEEEAETQEVKPRPKSRRSQT